MADLKLTGNNTNRAKYTAGVIGLILARDSAKSIGLSKGQSLIDAYIEIV